MSADFKTTQPGVNLAFADKMGPGGLDDASSNASGYKQAIEEIQRCVGINHIVQVNDCETSGDWTESDNGTFDYAVGTAGVRVGTNSLKLTATQSTDNTQYVETLKINESTAIPRTPDQKLQQNWNDCDYIGFWQHAVQSAEYGTAGEMTFAIVNDGTVSAKTNITGNVATSHQWMQIDISGLTRDKVEAIRFYSNNTNTAEDMYIDNIIRYKYSYNNAPLFGKYYYITSGTTLTEHQNMTWSIDGLIAGGTAALTDMGPGFLNAATATGTAARNVYGMCPIQFIFMLKCTGAVTAGEGVEVASATTFDDVDSGSEEMSVARALEGGAEASDWIFASIHVGGVEV